MRKPTPEEEVLAWRHLMWSLDFHRTVSLDNAKVVAILDRISKWVGAHNDANGERKTREVDANVANAFWALIAQTEPKPLPQRGRKKKVEEATVVSTEEPQE